MYFQHLWSALYLYLRPFIKWVLRRTTRLCELQRICYGERSGGPRCLGVEKSLEQSRTREIRLLIEELNKKVTDAHITENDRVVAINTVLQVKRINFHHHLQFVKSFGESVQQIWGYRRLFAEVEKLRKISYDGDNLEHETKLLELWNTLMPFEPLEGRISKQWQSIGFQGDDPKTDFRGMGLLGLENLLYFATEYPGPSSHVVSHSHHPKYGYTFAIVGINLTSMAYYLMKDGTARAYVYNVNHNKTDIKLFHKLYCYLFYEFDRFWIESKPQNMMEFSDIQRKFEENIRATLQKPNVRLKINLQTDNI